MKHRKFYGLLLLILATGLLTLGGRPVSADDDHKPSSKTFVVDDDLRCPGATYTSIQAAVAVAPPGSTIKVCPGTYQEQVRIDKELTVVGIPFGNQDAAIVKPNSVIANSSDGVAAIVLVENAKEVELDNLTVDGATNGISSCAPTLAGVYYHNASGEAEHLAVRNIRLGAGFLGCQSGFGILVQSDNGRTSNVEIEDNSVHDYQKNGITANDPGTSALIHGNAVSGIGPTPDIAQNGIQIGSGARGTIDDNSVINHIYAACTSASSCTTIATNILVFQSNSVQVSNNHTGKSQVNIFVQGGRGIVSGNTILDSDVFDGIDIVGDSNKVSKNRIFNSDDAGVFVQGKRNTVQGNFINEALEGILEFAPSSSNNFDDNAFYNVVSKIVRAGSSSTSPAAQTIEGQSSGARTVSPAHP
jgi:hypothetical protein